MSIGDDGPEPADILCGTVAFHRKLAEDDLLAVGAAEARR